MILGANNNFGQQVSHHFFGDAEAHLYITKTHVAPNQVIPNLQVSNVAQSRRIACNVIAGH